MNTGESDRLLKLETSANALVIGGKREVGPLVEFLQRFVYGTDLQEVWIEVYKLLGLSEQYENFVKVNPPKDVKDCWLLPMIKGATCNKVVSAMKSLGVEFCLVAEDLDKAVPTNDRDPNRDGSYRVFFAKNVEADPELANKSANQLKEAGHKGITLLERLLLEMAYYMASGKHLDAENITLCAGSRYLDGGVPRVDWITGHRDVYVSWCNSDSSGDDLRSRSVVSFAGEALPSQQ